jgi:hypothetical protein
MCSSSAAIAFGMAGLWHRSTRYGPTCAPSPYNSRATKAWRLFITSTIPAGLGILSVDWPQPQQLDGDMGDERVVSEQRLLTELNSRIRGVAEGPDGALYVLTDGTGGRILRLIPKK